MANNTISFSLELRSDPYSMDHAAKLDRLVEAARVVRDSDHCECKGCVEIFNALDDALTDLELPEKAKE